MYYVVWIVWSSTSSLSTALTFWLLEGKVGNIIVAFFAYNNQLLFIWQSWIWKRERTTFFWVIRFALDFDGQRQVGHAHVQHRDIFRLLSPDWPQLCVHAPGDEECPMLDNSFSSIFWILFCFFGSFFDGMLILFLRSLWLSTLFFIGIG